MKKINKIFTSIIILILVFLCLFIPKVQANFFTDDWDEEEKSDIEQSIDAEDGGIFEKIIAKMIRRNSRNSIFSYYK